MHLAEATWFTALGGKGAEKTGGWGWGSQSSHLIPTTLSQTGALSQGSEAVRAGSEQGQIKT